MNCKNFNPSTLKKILNQRKNKKKVKQKKKDQKLLKQNQKAFKECK